MSEFELLKSAVETIERVDPDHEQDCARKFIGSAECTCLRGDVIQLIEEAKCASQDDENIHDLTMSLIGLMGYFPECNDVVDYFFDQMDKQMESRIPA